MSVVVAYKWAANPQDADVAASGVVDWSRTKAAVSEYDPVAIGLGREIADATGTELVGVSVGTSAAGGPLAKKAAMSRGFDRGLVLADDDVAGWNPTKVAAALAALVAKAGDVTVVLTGDSSIDENAKMMSALVAGHLGWPCFQQVTAVAANGAGWSLTQQVPGGTRTVQVDGPVVVAVTPDAITPKIPGMKDILAAAKKPVEDVTAAGLSVTDIPVTVTGRARPETKARKNTVFTGDDAAAQLAAALRADGIV